MSFCDAITRCAVCGEHIHGGHGSQKYHHECAVVMYEFLSIELKRLHRRARQIAILKAAKEMQRRQNEHHT